MLMEILTNVKALALVVFFFGASIFVHELGHFLAARWRGLKVTRFSIGFGPKLFGWTRDGVEYIVAAFPIGGYVALPQLGHMEIIEGQAEDSESTPISWTSKFIVLVAGALFNVLFALGIASILYLMGGRPVLASNSSTEIGFVSENISVSQDEIVSNPAFTAGLRRGDVIIAIDGEPVDSWEAVDMKVIMGSQRTDDGRPLSIFTIQRNGRFQEVDIYPVIGGEEKIRLLQISPSLPAIIGAVFENSPAELAGLEPGDELVKINNDPIVSLHQISEFIQLHREQEIQFEILRNGSTITKVIKPVSIPINADGDKSPMIGVGWAAQTTTLKESPFKQIKNVVILTFDTLAKLIHPNSDIGLRHLSGPIGIGRLIYQSALADIRYVLWIVVIININLAILNLLPIPVLDGGHILFATIEKIRGRALPQNLLISLQSAFVFALLSLMVYVTAFDGLRIFRDNKRENSTEFRITFPIPKSQKDDINS
ncbi:MAG: RIP metalloprotease RseP [Verrucomicrobia bacterium]|nr:RIP metalloprotease RseP [Verrucomicrobiota bacterium]